jgi:signal transduction histidine kinase
MFPRLLSIVFFTIILPYKTGQQKSAYQSPATKQNAASAVSGKEDSVAVNSLNTLAEKYYQKLSDSSFLFANRALKIAEKIGYARGQTKAYAVISKMHYRRADYTLSLSTALKSLNIAVREHDKEGEANAHNLLGLIYIAQQKNNLGLAEIEKSAVLNKNTGNLNLLSANYLNISLAYFGLNNLDSAISYVKLCKSLCLQINNYPVLAIANNHLGDYYLKLNKVDQAINYYSSVVNNKSFQSDWENSFAYSGLANCYYHKKAYKAAVSMGMKGYQLARKTDTKWDIERALNIIYQSYYALGENKEAFAYLLLDKQYNDSLFNENKDKEINTLRLKQKEAENDALIKSNKLADEKNSADQMFILIVLLVAAFLVVVALITYSNNVKKNKLNAILQKNADDIARQKQQIETQNNELNRLNQTKDQIFSVIGHDLRGPFATILNSLAFLKAGEFKEDERELLFNHFFEQVAVTSAMLENLLLWAYSQQNGISAKPTTVYLPDIVNQVLKVFGGIATEKQIAISHTEDPAAYITADPDQIRIILQNIIANAIKFTNADGNIAITYSINDDWVKISIKDNGLGMSAPAVQQLFSVGGKKASSYGTKNEKGIGLGLILVKQFIDENNGLIDVYSQEHKGTEFIIAFVKYPKS